MILMPLSRPALLAFAAAAGMALSAPVAAEVDADAAKLLFKQNDCHKCHNPEKAKKGPSLKKTAKEYKGKPDAVKKVIEHMTAGKKVKLDDGTEEDHKIIDTKDVKVQTNVARWMLSH